MNVLVIAAHPDDEVLGCGATIAKRSRSGDTVFVAILGEGVTSRFGSREQADATLTDSLRTDCRKAGALLGVQDLFLHDLPDNRFDTVPLLDVVKMIESVIDRVHPTIVFTHSGGDLNIDHVFTHRAVLTATRPLAGTVVKTVYAFEVASSTEWALQQFCPPFRPTVFVDVTDTLDAKINAMRCYEGELRSFPHPRSAAAIEITAKRWGTVAGLETAEAFELIREIR